MRKLRVIFLLSFFLPFSGKGAGHPDTLPSYRLDTLRLAERISQYLQLAEIPHSPFPPDTLKTLPYINYRYRLYKPVPLRLMEKTLVFRFRIYNPEDRPRKVFFSPGSLYRNRQLFKESKNHTGLLKITDSFQITHPYEEGVLLQLSPGEDATFYLTIDFIRSNTNIIIGQLIQSNFYPSWQVTTTHWSPNTEMMTYIITGILLMMVMYSFTSFMQVKNPEYIYYCIYAAGSALLIFLKSYGLGIMTPLIIFYEEFLDFIILCTGIICYLMFARSFLNTSVFHPWLDRFLKYSSYTLGAMLLIYSAAFFLSPGYLLIYYLENFVIKLLMMSFGIVFIVYGLRVYRNDRLIKYLMLGNCAILVFSLLSLLTFFNFKPIFWYPDSIFNRGLVLYEIGVMLELAFFLFGLSFKNQQLLSEKSAEEERLKLENQRKEFEKQMAIVSTRQEERDRISADMHDELGSGMTAIRLMSEIMKTRMSDGAFPELEKISNQSNDLLGKMNSIIWTMKSSNDSLESLVAYVRSHALEYFENTTIRCRVRVPEQLPEVEMNGEKRRNIFLSVKESLNNLLKHAQATEVGIDLWLENNQLYIRVVDNGVGIDEEKLRRFGNGLSNMRRRMESIAGELIVHSGPGTTLTFIAPL